MLSKTAFVASATEEYGIDGRPTNISRVALLCGLSRKEVRRQRDILAEPAASAQVEKTTDATRVLSAWFHDEDFITTDGQPAVLTKEAFEDLCRRYSNEVPASAMLKELLRVGAVAQLEDGGLEVRARYYMPTNTDSQWMLTAGRYLADLANSISFNVDLEAGAQTRFLGRATETHIAADMADEFRVFLEQEGQAFLERVDAWLGEHQVSPRKETEVDTVRLGVGVFQIQGADPDEPR